MNTNESRDYRKKVKPRLEEVRTWSANGASQTEIAKMLGIGRSTLYIYYDQYRDFRDAIDQPRNNTVIKLKESLLRRALGGTYKTVVESEKQVLDKDGVPATLTNRSETVSEIAPDVKAAIALLKNMTKYKVKEDDIDMWQDDPYTEDIKKKELNLKQDKQELDID